MVATKEVKGRAIILTDMENEPDDSQTMVKAMMYSNEVDFEGLIAVTSRWLQNRVFPESIVDRVLAYGEVRANLQKHARGWPTVEHLMSRIGSGVVAASGYGMEAVGDGKSTDGSNLIIAAVDRDDPRPVHVCINAGANTLAQALWDVRKSRTVDETARFVAKLRVYDDAGQDEAGAWICHNFPDIFYVRSQQQVFGLYGGGDGTAGGPQVCQPSQEAWANEHIRRGHGVLGALYPQRLMKDYNMHVRYFPLDGGGTTTWIGHVNKGLYDPAQPSWGGWGGRFTAVKHENVAASIEAVRPAEAKYRPYWMYMQTADTWSDGQTEWKDNVFAPLFRWRKDYTNDFQARMDWCVADYRHANHHPVAAFNGDTTRTIVRMQADPGQAVDLDASASSDPDGDQLTFRWYVYPEAGNYGQAMSIEQADGAKAGLRVPRDAAGKQIHIILEVADTNEIASLKSYRRVVVDVGG